MSATKKLLSHISTRQDSFVGLTDMDLALLKKESASELASLRREREQLRDLLVTANVLIKLRIRDNPHPSEVEVVEQISKVLKETSHESE